MKYKERHIIDGEHHNHVEGWTSGGSHLHYFIHGKSLCGRLVLDGGDMGGWPKYEMYRHTDPRAKNCPGCLSKLDKDSRK